MLGQFVKRVGRTQAGDHGGLFPLGGAPSWSRRGAR